MRNWLKYKDKPISKHMDHENSSLTSDQQRSYDKHDTIWCMMYDVWYMISMMYDVWYRIYDNSDVWCTMHAIISSVWCIIYDKSDAIISSVLCHIIGIPSSFILTELYSDRNLQIEPHCFLYYTEQSTCSYYTNANRNIKAGKPKWQS